MKRWQSVAATIGYLIIVAFVVVRSLRVRTSWADWREFLPILGGIGVAILLVAAALLAIFAVPWVGYWLWRKIRREPPDDTHIQRQHSFAVHVRHFVWICILSAVTGLVTGGLMRRRSPGWVIAMTLGFWAGAHHLDLNLGLMLLLAVGVDSAISFAILWGVYLLWLRLRR
jgi:hypothetical protein